MPKRKDLKKILVVGAGPIILVRLVNLITQEHKPVKL
jgi:precorrin isomerase